LFRETLYDVGVTNLVILTYFPFLFYFAILLLIDEVIFLEIQTGQLLIIVLFLGDIILHIPDEKRLCEYELGDKVLHLFLIIFEVDTVSHIAGVGLRVFGGRLDALAGDEDGLWEGGGGHEGFGADASVLELEHRDDPFHVFFGY
jgi:hypothetical protein